MVKSMATRSSQRLLSLYDQITFCRSCSTWGLPRAPKAAYLKSRRPRNRRNASTWTSRTAINATKPVPLHLKPLYDALVEVRKHAAQHVNTSRLQLALQGLESQHPTIRIAVLGVNVPVTARRIARLLLADPLEDEGQWEQQLIDEQGSYTRGLVIRYGKGGDTGMPQPKNSVPVLYIPAEVLERHNLELLVSSVSTPTGDRRLQPVSTPADTFLSPAVGTPTSFEGRQTMISQPVHKTLLVLQGLEEMVAVSRLLASTNFSSIEDRDSVHVAINLHDTNVQDRNANPFIIDAEAAEEGLAAIRTSVTQATKYEHKWMASGMTELSRWMLQQTTDQSERTTLSHTIESLISAVLHFASSNIEATRLSSYQTATEHSLSRTHQILLETALEEFSRSAHQELQSGLASAWSSRNWRKLAWYKLFWRVDDVGLIVTDLVNSAWLPRTERAVYGLSGRLVQAGINPVMPSVTGDKSASDIQPETSSETTSQPLLEPSTNFLSQPATLATTSVTATSSETMVLTPTPTPSSHRPSNTPQNRPETNTIPMPLTTMISTARRAYILHQTTNLTTTAQQLLLRTLTLTGATSALTLLTTSSLTLYEASTILAVGVTYSLYKLQKGWMHATRTFEQNLFIKGREVISDVTSSIQTLIQQSKEIKLDPSEIRTLDKAKNAVDRAQSALDKLKSPVK